jgi:YhcH/YjgK/YiaL family protein
MIIDKLENLDLYVGANPLFEKAFNFLKLTDLETAECGKIYLQDKDLWVNITEAQPKTQEQARLETHNEYIDIQIPLTHTERMGYTPRTDLPEAPYNAEKDITFYEGQAQNYLEVKPGMFAIFFPQDGHAPAISPTPWKKVIVKVKVNKK